MDILAINIGNTLTTLTFFNGKNIRHIRRVPTSDLSKSSGLKKLFRFNRRFDACAVASVVPAKTGIIVARIRKMNHSTRIFIPGENIRVPVKNVYKHPSDLGQDRLIASYAAVRLFKTGAIIIDSGTATTIDVVTADYEHLGGLILPGIKMSFLALQRETALLPLVNPGPIYSLLGTSTRSCIRNGVILGQAALLENIISRIRKENKGRFSVIGTGGGIAVLKPYITSLCKTEENLIAHGLRLLVSEKTPNSAPTGQKAINGRKIKNNKNKKRT